MDPIDEIIAELEAKAANLMDELPTKHITEMAVIMGQVIGLTQAQKIVCELTGREFVQKTNQPTESTPV